MSQRKISEGGHPPIILTEDAVRDKYKAVVSKGVESKLFGSFSNSVKSSYLVDVHDNTLVDLQSDCYSKSIPHTSNVASCMTLNEISHSIVCFSISSMIS